MLFSQTAEYALRAAVHLAANTKRPQTNQQIADATRVPAGYLSKVLQALARGGLVRAQRGIGGGFNLDHPPHTVTVLDVVNAVDPIQRITTCPLGLKSHGRNLCPLHRKLDDALGLVEEALGSTTLTDLLGSSSTSAPLCEVTVEGAGRAAKDKG